jgi:hypothetical protein
MAQAAIAALDFASGAVRAGRGPFVSSRIAIARRFALALSAGLALSAFFLVGQAHAQTCVAPPGTSGIDQYCESIPSPGSDSGGGGNHSGSHPLSEETQRSLHGKGAVGQQILDLASGKSGPDGGDGSRKSGGHDAGGSADASHAPGTADEPSDNPLSAVRSAVDSGSEAGPGFVWILVILGLLLSALAWLRFRRRGQAPDA